MDAGVDLVRVRDVDPRIVIDVRYATASNFVGRAIYSGADAWLRRGTAERLRRAQDGLVSAGLRLKVLDAYRPPAAQALLWAALPDERFVAPPSRGSRHTRGMAVDVTLVDALGAELQMPSAFDAFNERAHRDWKGEGDADAVVVKNRELLTAAMIGAGFETIRNEWWHYDDPEWRNGPLLEVEFEALERLPRGRPTTSGCG